MRVRENLGGIINNLGRNNFSSNNNFIKTGKVYGIVTTENTPTEKQFERAGGFNGIGTILYLDYNQSINVSGSNLDSFLDGCSIAAPLTSDTHIPALGEVVVLYNGLPSYASEVSPNAYQLYYGETINLFNNTQNNSLSTSGKLGKTLNEKADIRSLNIFEGDKIVQGRNGNGIRFGSTVTYYSDVNEWSSGGSVDGDPITIMVNGYVTTDTGSLSPNIEEINKEMSSIYMTSTQLLPLLPDRNDLLNPLTKPTPANQYNFSQVILNSDRVTLNSKKDEVMIFAKTNVEINTNNQINLNAKDKIHLNTQNIIWLGTLPDNTQPYEPLLLGTTTQNFLADLMDYLNEFGNNLKSVITTPEGSPLTGVNTAAETFAGKIETLTKKLSKLTSKNTFTI